MMKITKKEKHFKGVFSPIVTVFDDKMKICPEKIAENIRTYNKTNLTGYMPLGSNGEFMGLTEDEALEVLKVVVSEASEEKIIVGGCGRESVEKTIHFIKKVAACGLNYAFILPPHYFAKQMTDTALMKFFFSVAEQSPIPIVLYNAPKFAGGVSISPALAVLLSEHENIVALKNSSPAPNRDYLQAMQGTDFEIIAGNIGNFYTGMLEGCDSGVLSTACYLPEFCTRLYDLVKNGQIKEAGALSSKLQTISTKTAGNLAVPGVKCAMDVRGMNGGSVRLPLMNLTKLEKEHFEAVFEKYEIGKID
ncbi:MAG: dihydrodipicolinate synthase family protein [Lachnospiraceae bacterium]|nr:dihydrodipicolinate synthase family protein [Lachnospiraceae bacterium]